MRSAIMVKKKNNKPRRNTKQTESLGSSFADHLSDKVRDKLLGLGDTNIKNMIAAARNDPKVIEAEKNFAKKSK
jgi:hypothetical protein